MEALRERFGKYHVLEKIAQGGMAEVYKVKTVGIAGFEKIQALKRILPRSAREGRFIRSFIDEARIAVELTHRNIVQVFDFGKADGELFLAMELIEGKDLRTAMGEAVARDVLPPIPVAAYIISEAAAGLDYAHRKTDLFGGSLGIVHCDVSPSNVMLSTDGYVKILDFGIARASFASALERRRLRGKPRYMAPEQTIGDPPTTAADVFALAIIAWELFTGLPLYRAENLKAILEAVRTTVPPRIDQHNPDVPAEIVDAIAIALSREPADRGSAADLALACARTAMLAGAHATSAWLAQLERPHEPDAPAWSSDGTSVSVPDRSGGGAPRPAHQPSRPSATVSLMRAAPASRRSTASLANVPPPPPSLGEGTPGFAEPHAVAEAAPAEAPFDATTRASHRFEFERGTTAIEPGDPRPTPVPRGWPAPIAPTATLTGERDSEPSSSLRWNNDPTMSGIARLADAHDPSHDPLHDPSHDPSFQHREATVPSEPPFRSSYEVLTVVPGTMPAAHRYEDPGRAELVPEDTSYDEPLDAEEPTTAVRDHDEAIDDHVSDAGAAVEHRRAVIAVALVTGAHDEARRSLAHSLGELAYQRGGVVLEHVAGCLTIAFGLEIAGDDDVAVAMGWAIAARAMARDAIADPGTGVHGRTPGGGDPGALSLQIGARTGVVAALDRREDHPPRIAPDDLASVRLLATAASPDHPLFTGAARAAEQYQVREVEPPAAAARFGATVELIAAQDGRARPQLERRGLFVGRGPELAELDGWFDQAVTDDRRVVALLGGAAGSGKSRLVAEVVARRRHNPRVITVVANPANRLAPFALVIELYEAALGVAVARNRRAPQLLVQRLLRVLTTAGIPPARARSVAVDLDRAIELRDGMSLGAPEVADLRPRISAGLATLREAMADRARPLLTIIDDVHHADRASLEVLRHALAVPQAGPELMVLTTRTEDDAGPASTLLHERGTAIPVDVELAIGDLVGRELRALIADRLGDEASPANIAAVLARGGGNPLAVEELAQAVREAGADVPGSAREVVEARFERLSPPSMAVLRIAAVLGDPVHLNLLEELIAVDGVALEPALDELVAGAILAPSAGGRAVQFSGGHVREAAYESMSARAQHEHHARVGRLLAARFWAGRQEAPSVIAEHLERGGDPASAAAFWLRAGRLALTASDADTAIACFSRTLVLERELGEPPPTLPSRVRRREALAGREEAHRLRGDLSTDASDVDELMRLCEGDPARLADVAIRRALRLLRWGDYAGASVATVVAQDHANAAGDVRLHGEALRVRAEILERVGRFDEALLVVGQARDLFRQAGAVSDEMAARVGSGRIHLLRAQYEAARAAYQPVVARIQQTGDPWLERIVTNHLAVIEMCLGNFGEAMASAERSLELCRHHGDRGREGDALSVAGIIALEVGLYDRAAATFTEALALLSRTGSRWSRADCLVYAGVCDVRRGHTEGIRLLDTALDEARELGARYLEANALVSRAGAHLQLGALEAAIADATEGTAVAQQATLVGYEIQALARHARALARQGDAARGRELARRAITLLDQQRHVEGSEEEVFAACAEVLATAGAPGEAAGLRHRGRASAQRKLAAMTDPAWRAAYLAIPEIAALVR